MILRVLYCLLKCFLQNFYKGFTFWYSGTELSIAIGLLDSPQFAAMCSVHLLLFLGAIQMLLCLVNKPYWRF